METYDLTQTGAQVQDILDKAAQLPSKATLDTELNAKADKSNTYTKAEVDRLVQTLENGSYERVDTYEDLGDPTEDKAGIIWLVGLEDAEEFDRYIIGKSGDTYEWVYMGTTSVDLTGKADKVADAVDGDLAGLDGSGNLLDSGYKPADFATAEQGAKADSAYQLPGSGIPEDDLATEVQNTLNRVNNKADKVSGATNNHLAALNSAGNLKDSGVSVEDIENKIAAVDSAKPDKASSNPAMLVGSALGIMGNTPQAALFTHRAVPAGAGRGAAQMRLLRGRSIVWNQLVPNNRSSEEVNGITYGISNGIMSFSGKATAQGTRNLVQIGVGIRGHKLYFNAPPLPDQSLSYRDASTSTTITPGSIYTPRTDVQSLVSIGVFVPNGFSFDGTWQGGVDVIDLTAMYGDGNEPTADQFKALYPGFHGYNAGTIKNLMATGLLSDGFQQWDEEWENGRMNITTGATTTGNGLRSKNFIPVVSGATYYYKKGSLGGNMYALYYDANKNYISYEGCEDQAKQAPANCCYIKFYIPTSSEVTSYPHDICVNRSSARNGQYEPYRSYTTSWPITTMTGKAGGVGDSVVIYPDGMMSAGTAFDYGRVDADGWMRKMQKVLMMVNLGELEWTDNTYQTNTYFSASVTGIKASTINLLCSALTQTAAGNVVNGSVDNSIAVNSSAAIIAKASAYATPAAFKAAMAGVYAVIELATPIEYVMDTPIYMGYPVDADGMETMLPDQTGLSDPTSAPIDYDVIYPIDLPGNLATELNAMLTANSLAGSFSKDGNGGVTYSAE